MPKTNRGLSTVPRHFFSGTLEVNDDSCQRRVRMRNARSAGKVANALIFYLFRDQALVAVKVNAVVLTARFLFAHKARDNFSSYGSTLMCCQFEGHILRSISRWVAPLIKGY